MGRETSEESRQIYIIRQSCKRQVVGQRGDSDKETEGALPGSSAWEGCNNSIGGMEIEESSVRE